MAGNRIIKALWTNTTGAVGMEQGMALLTVGLLGLGGLSLLGRSMQRDIDAGANAAPSAVVVATQAATTHDHAPPSISRLPKNAPPLTNPAREGHRVDSIDGALQVVFGFVGSAVDAILPGHGLLPGHVIDGILPGRGFRGKHGFISWLGDVGGAVLDWFRNPSGLDSAEDLAAQAFEDHGMKAEVDALTKKLHVAESRVKHAATLATQRLRNPDAVTPGQRRRVVRDLTPVVDSNAVTRIRKLITQLGQSHESKHAVAALRTLARRYDATVTAARAALYALRDPS